MKHNNFNLDDALKNLDSDINWNQERKKHVEKKLWTEIDKPPRHVDIFRSLKYAASIGAALIIFFVGFNFLLQVPRTSFDEAGSGNNSAEDSGNGAADYNTGGETADHPMDNADEEESGNDANGGEAEEGFSYDLGDMLNALEFVGLEIEEADMNSDNVFQQQLNGVNPAVYQVETGTLTIYVFPSARALDAGRDDFEKITAGVELVSYEEYQVENVLLYYVFDDNESEETNEKIHRALDLMLVR